MLEIYTKITNLPSSSTMVTEAWSVAPPGGKDDSILSKNTSLSSNILSSIIEILNELSVDPAGKIALNGPKS